VLRALDVPQREPIAFYDCGQDMVLLVAHRVVEPFRVDRDEARAHEHGARRAECDVARRRLARDEVERDRVVDGGFICETTVRFQISS
jgi:hypothetical protein